MKQELPRSSASNGNDKAIKKSIEVRITKYEEQKFDKHSKECNRLERSWMDETGQKKMERNMEEPT